MLTPDEVNGYAGLMAAPWDELSERILRDMVRRIVKTGSVTATAQWQSYRAQALGASRAYLLQQMQAIVQQLGPQEAAVFAQAMKQAYGIDVQDAAAAGRSLAPLGESEEAQQIIQSGYRRTMNTLYNLTQTRAVMGNQNMVETTQRQLAYYLDMAHADAVSGAFSSDDSARRALNELAAKGVGAITYPSGHMDSLDVVVLRATRTGINQTAGEITRFNADQLECDLMELDAHVCAHRGRRAEPDKPQLVAGPDCQPERQARLPLTGRHRLRRRARLYGGQLRSQLEHVLGGRKCAKLHAREAGRNQRSYCILQRQGDRTVQSNPDTACPGAPDQGRETGLSGCQGKRPEGHRKGRSGQAGGLSRQAEGLPPADRAQAVSAARKRARLWPQRGLQRSSPGEKMSRAGLSEKAVLYFRPE